MPFGQFLPNVAVALLASVRVRYALNLYIHVTDCYKYGSFRRVYSSIDEQASQQLSLSLFRQSVPLLYPSTLASSV